ncbi:MAG TPA: 16S rRNA (guanine(527)-N(7))-methyltransferase RsmG [Bacteroidia bacterium]|jgi:16S rRNA (guanine527-N7)-methyltransferase|nr:16S rRNA (guanine(527)-N(7))-methyltransferase RsmG [Bacteroidia bacterium]
MEEVIPVEDSIALIQKYFQLPEKKLALFTQLGLLYHEWNEKINLISRKDMDHLYLHHILHSLSIAKLISFKDGTRIIDVGTGGGLPGIPLAIMFPQCSFLLVDSIGKKIKVVEEIVKALGIDNAFALNARAENIDEDVEFVTGRAVSNLQDFHSRVQHLILPNKKKSENTLPNGLLYLAGGDVETDLGRLKERTNIYPLDIWFDEEFYKSKKIVFVKR